MTDTPQLSATQEDYLAAIFDIKRSHGEIRSNVIADTLGVTRPTVTTALKSLAALGLIKYQPYQPVVLTEMGSRHAKAMLHRTVVLRSFFHETLQFPLERAEQYAAKLGHAIDDDGVIQLARLLLFLDQTDAVPDNWPELYHPHQH